MIAITCILAGLYVVFRPFLAWGLLIFVVIGAILLTGFAHVFSPGPWWVRVLPAAAAVGVVATILIYPGMTISLLVLLAAASLIITALSRMIGAVRGRHGDRYASMVSGLAALLLAVTALAWPDATVFLVATIFGVYLVLFGVELLVHVWRGARSDRDSSTAASIVPSRGARVRTGVAASLALVGSIALVAGGLALSGTPQPDGFYTPPDGLPPQAGVLLSAQVFTRDVPAGAEGWRILYTTTNGDDEIITASGLVIAPTDATRSPLGEHAERNVPRLLISAPVFLAQGLTDTLVVPAMQQGYVSERCAARQVIDYREYPDADHMGLVADQTLLDDLMSWTTDRFAGQSAATECARG